MSGVSRWFGRSGSPLTTASPFGAGVDHVFLNNAKMTSRYSGARFKVRRPNKKSIKQPYYEAPTTTEFDTKIKLKKYFRTGQKGRVFGFPRSIEAADVDKDELDDDEGQQLGFEGDTHNSPLMRKVFGEWQPRSKRVGAIGRKIGIMGMWDQHGVRRACTVIRMEKCEVLEVKKLLTGQNLDEPQIHLQVGAGVRGVRKTRKAQLCHYRKIEMEPKEKVWDFEVTPDAILPVGTEITSRHFVPGQKVDVQGITKGKGFCGVMKRWGMAGNSASHGNSRSHRKIGSLGGCQDPGKVWKGKRMPGRLGGKNKTIQSLLVYKVDVERNLLYINNPIPGPKGTMIRIKDADWHQWAYENPPPFPTYISKEGEEPVNELIADVTTHKDPFEIYMTL